MKTIHRSRLVPAFLACALALALTIGSATPSPALSGAALPAATTSGAELPKAGPSTSELLEKGIYTEQTVGDLAAAIAIYSQVVGQADANRPHLAQAHLRLGICYLKQGQDEEARKILDKVILEFPEQEQVLAQAREVLAAAQSDLDLLPVPWKDGEFLQYRMSLPTGKVIGAIYLMAKATVVNGVEAWELELRRFAGNSAKNYGVSRVLVEATTQLPISSTLRHGTLGNAQATFGPHGAEITSGKAITQVESDQQLYDNDQSMHLIRMLPLEPGYKTQLNLLPIWTGTILETRLKVKKKETCSVPAGDFECFVLNLDVGQSQTLWFSTGPEQHLVRLKDGGVEIELAKIGQLAPGASIAFANKDFGFSGLLPSGWIPYEHRESDRATQLRVRLLDPEAESISSIEVDRCPGGRCPTLQRSAERELSGAKRRFDDYQLREDSWAERTIDGRPAISFVGDYRRDGEDWVQYRLYTITDDTRFEFIFRTPSESFDEYRAAFDSILENLDAE